MAQAAIKQAWWSEEKEKEYLSLKGDLQSTENTLERAYQAKKIKDSEISALKVKNEQLMRDYEEMANKADKITDEKESIQQQLKAYLLELELTRSNLVKTNEQRQRDFEQMEITVMKYKVENEDIQNKLRSVLQELEKTTSLLQSKEYEVNELKLKVSQTAGANSVQTIEQQQKDLDLMGKTIEKYRIENEATTNKLGSALHELKKTKSIRVQTDERHNDFTVMENTLREYKVENEATQRKLGSVLQELEETKCLLEVDQLKLKRIHTKRPVSRLSCGSFLGYQKKRSVKLFQ